MPRISISTKVSIIAAVCDAAGLPLPEIWAVADLTPEALALRCRVTVGVIERTLRAAGVQVAPKPCRAAVADEVVAAKRAEPHLSAVAAARRFGMNDKAVAAIWERYGISRPGRNYKPKQDQPGWAKLRPVPHNRTPAVLEAQVIAAKRDNPRLGTSEASQRFGVTRSCIGKIWKRAGVPSEREPSPAELHREAVIQAKRDDPAMTEREAAARFGVSVKVVSRIWRGAEGLATPKEAAALRRATRPSKPPPNRIPKQVDEAVVATKRANPSLNAVKIAALHGIGREAARRALREAGLLKPPVVSPPVVATKPPRLAPGSRIPEAMRQEIIAAKQAEPNLSQPQAAARFGVSRKAVARLWQRHDLRGSQAGGRAVSNRESIIEAKRADPTISYRQAAERFGVSQRHIGRIWREAGVMLVPEELAKLRAKPQPPSTTGRSQLPGAIVKRLIDAKLADPSLSVERAVKQFKHCRRTVKRAWIKHGLMDAPEPAPSAARPPSPRRIPEEEEARIVAAKRRDPDMYVKTAVALFGRTKGVIRRIWREAGLVDAFGRSLARVDPDRNEPAPNAAPVKPSGAIRKNDEPLPQDGIRIAPLDDPMGPVLVKVYGNRRPVDMPAANLNKEADVLERINARRGFAQARLLRQRGSGYAA